MNHLHRCVTEVKSNLNTTLLLTMVTKATRTRLIILRRQAAFGKLSERIEGLGTKMQAGCKKLKPLLLGLYPMRRMGNGN